MAAWQRPKHGSLEAHRAMRAVSKRGWSRTARARATLAFTLALMLAIGGRAAVVTATPEGGADGPPESGPASIEVHVAACESGYAGADYYADCHGNGVADIAVTLASAVNRISAAGITEVAAGEPGIAFFDGLPADEYTVTVEIPGHDATFETYCSATNGETTVSLTPEDARTGTFTLYAGQAVVCDWYVIPEDLSGRSPAPTIPSQPADDATANGELVTTLPRTGAGMDASGDGATWASLALAFSLGLLGVGVAARHPQPPSPARLPVHADDPSCAGGT